MTANLSFEAESFGGFTGSYGGSQESEIVHGPQRPGAFGQSPRDHRASGYAAPVRGRVAGPAARNVFASPHAGIVRGPMGGVHIPGRPGFGRGVGDIFHRGGVGNLLGRGGIGHVFGRGGVGNVFGRAGIGNVFRRDGGLFRGGLNRGFLNRGSWGHGWAAGRPFGFGGTGGFAPSAWRGGRYFPGGGGFRHGFRGRWPWMSRDWAGGAGIGAMGSGGGFGDGDYAGPGGGAPSGGGFDPSAGAAGSGSAPDSGSGFSPSPDDPQIVSWAQGCLAHLVGGWVPQDGTLGRLTQRALQVFQTHAQLPSTGTLDEQTLSALQQACEASAAASGSSTQSPGQSPAQGPAPDASGGAPPAGAAPDPSAAPPSSDATSAPSDPASGGTPPAGAPPAAAPDAKEIPYWAHESYEDESYEMENEDHPGSPGAQRVCEPDRCTSAYLRWVQTSLNQLFGQRLAVSGILDDPTIAAINRFRLAKRLKINESYHIGPAIESALLSAGATTPPAVSLTQCGVSDPSKLIPILDQSRGDIPLEFLLGWIDVESAWVLEPPSVTCERGFFQLYPEDSVALGLDHDRIGTDAVYSAKAGIPFVNRARKAIARAVKAFGVPQNSDLYWRLVKLWHWIPSGPEKILASMSSQGVRGTDWEGMRAFVNNNSAALTKIINRDPRDGMKSVDHMFRRVSAWRTRLHR